jgi:hypothetical protein
MEQKSKLSLELQRKWINSHLSLYCLDSIKIERERERVDSLVDVAKARQQHQVLMNRKFMKGKAINHSFLCRPASSFLHF